MENNELLKDILEALCDLPMEVWTQPALKMRLAGYSDAVCKVCNIIEDAADPDDLGEHLATTRRQFGMIS